MHTQCAFVWIVVVKMSKVWRTIGRRHTEYLFKPYPRLQSTTWITKNKKRTRKNCLAFVYAFG